MTTHAEGGRVDAWLWRARFFKTRADAAAFVSAGRVRLFRGGVVSRLDKPSRAVRPGDELVFVLSARVRAVRVLAIGERRGPPSAARALFTPLDAENEDDVQSS